MTSFGTLLSLAFFLYFLSRRLPRLLHIFQQEEYDGARFLAWILRTLAFDRRVSALLLVAGAAGMLSPGDVKAYLPAVVLGLSARYEPDPRQSAKKKLAMTARASRIYYVSLILAGLAAWGGLALGHSFGAVVVMQLLPLTLVIGNGLLAPYETMLQTRIRRQAMQHLQEIAPRVVGITGSFGKTSVKHILGHVLTLNAPTLFTPGSVNTLMGISRVIRENLRKGCKFFLVEMGAYGEGSIARLCGLTPPSAGIVTALGAAHYERFGSLDAVAHAKFELADAVLKAQDGFVVVHEQVLQQPYARDYVAAHRAQFVVCGVEADADLRYEAPLQTPNGLEVAVAWQGQRYTLFAPLYGVQHGGNMALAFACAAKLGIAPDRIVAALRSTPQITHRLEVKNLNEPSVMIDDAYNSNPAGFQAALSILDMLGQHKKARRVLVTPGVTELGVQHDAVHQTLGQEAAARTDIALVVRPDVLKSFIEGYESAGGTGKVVPVADLTAARAWLAAHPAAAPFTGDVVLFENDLPDVLERRLSL